MPPRDENGRIFRHDIENLRVALSDGTEMQLSEVAHITEEDIIDTPSNGITRPLNSGEFTATIDTSLNLDALTALIGEAPGAPPSPPWYDELVEVRAPVMPAEPAVNRNGSAVDRALREITRRVQESGVVERMRANTILPRYIPWHDDATFVQGVEEMEERIRQNIQESIYQQLERELSGVADAVASSARSAASASSAISDWMNALNVAWASVGEDFELGEEEQYQATDPLSFDELMGFGGESK